MFLYFRIFPMVFCLLGGYTNASYASLFENFRSKHLPLAQEIESFYHTYQLKIIPIAKVDALIAKVKKNKQFTPITANLILTRKILSAKDTPALQISCQQSIDQNVYLHLSSFIKFQCYSHFFSHIYPKQLNNDSAKVSAENFLFDLLSEKKNNILDAIHGSLSGDALNHFKNALNAVMLKSELLPSSKLLQSLIERSEINFLVNKLHAHDFDPSLRLKPQLNQKIALLEKLLVNKNNKQLVNLIGNEIYRFGIENKKIILSSPYPQSKQNAKNLLRTAKRISRFGDSALSDKLFKLIMDSNESTDDEIYQEALFSYIWNSIVRDQYGEALTKIKELKLDIYTNTSSPNILFWTAYVFENQGHLGQASTLYRQIIFNRPLNFYAVAASKKLASMSFIKQKNQLENILKRKSPDTNLNFLSEDASYALQRFQLWAQLPRNSFLRSEKAYLYQLAEQGNISFVEQNSLSKLALQLAQELSRRGNYLESFYLMSQDLIDTPEYVNIDLLKTLFPTPFIELVEKNAPDFHPHIVLSLMRQESAFNPYAISSAGATGLMQLMPQTAKQIDRNAAPKKLNIPAENIKIGTTYLRKLYQKYDKNLPFTLMAYNAGEGNLAKWRGPIINEELPLLKQIESIPFQETRDYVKFILRNIYYYQVASGAENDTPDLAKIFSIPIIP